MNNLIKLLYVFAIVFCCQARSENTDNRLDFLKEVRSFSCEFKQSIVDPKGIVKSYNNGFLRFKKPGKFRWEIVNNSRQLVVSDGKNIYQYDSDLCQAISKNIYETSLAFFMDMLSSDNLDKFVDIKYSYNRDDMYWLSVTTNDLSSGFRVIDFGFDDRFISKIHLLDVFDQKFVIELSNILINNELPEDLFEFILPSNVDLVEM
ncbi:outer membrane lipoprotein carrier protein [Candidatus Kinetoplastibacterium oncopeltii TCC290E]|uniref:Outer membrane lipoprotein carrier protein n=1 Tax=Candidatus Kinetoplastidibacterium stringomonadis TCC290E TaxID=1208920 RepID=M1LZG5_9PROT|nr:outer-membrane lipoprotein carrier protein LolA [Candidatus Kinetoplastibacterium oncopeltii]AGF48504.1 outer membrane lipoprotein carrier protein [Candidatus Kinetoplastibacterium oncopeltii TCC290E]